MTNQSPSGHTLFQGKLGQHITQAAKDAIEWVKTRPPGSYALTFNGHEVPITPETTADQVVKSYEVTVKAAQDAWDASPEGKAHAARQAAQEAKERAREAAGPEHDEATMRASEIPRFTDSGELKAYVDSLVNGKHSYGSAAMAMALAASAAMQYVASELGVTGFQHGAAVWEVLTREWRIQGPAILIKAEDGLYPQNDSPVKEATKFMNRKEVRQWLKDEATKRLQSDSKHAADRVVKHWKTLSEMVP